ncbi:hypothetical protein PG993_014915 [Apiospora rasikravindrae]|uniref:Transposase n=1 Tax=Apiospora rasikravindrae TaxID=990691 RepID=A0ABR1RP35_9PEZI
MHPRPTIRRADGHHRAGVRKGAKYAVRLGRARLIMAVRSCGERGKQQRRAILQETTASCSRAAIDFWNLGLTGLGERPSIRWTRDSGAGPIRRAAWERRRRVGRADHGAGQRAYGDS